MKELKQNRHILALILAVFGMLLYYRAIFWEFKVDDIWQVVEAEEIYTLANVPSFFRGGVGYQREDVGFTQFFYRPVMFSSFSLIYALPGADERAFHSVQILFFIGSVVLLFLFLCKFTNDFVAFLLTALFVIHPASIETATYVSLIQDTLYMFFGLSALVVIAFNKAKATGQLRMLLISALLLISCLAKETGFLFIPITATYAYFFRRREFTKYLSTAAFVAAAYLLLRFLAWGNYYFKVIESVWQATTPIDRLAISSTSLRFYIQEMFLPGLLSVPLAIDGPIQLSSAVVSIAVVLAALVLLVIGGLLVRIQNVEQFKYFVFFAFWILIGLAFHSHVFGLEVFVAERFVYFPMIGFLGLTAVLVNTFVSKRNILITSVYLLMFLLYFGQYYLAFCCS